MSAPVSNVSSVVSDERRIAGRWTWIGELSAASMSVAGNAWHIVLLDSSMGLALRLAWAVCWPIGVVIGIKVLIHVPWRHGAKLDLMARAVLMVPVALVAAVVSYRHQSALILLADPSDPFSAAIGPLAIDGLMLGCTVALLVLRAQDVARRERERSLEAVSAPDVDSERRFPDSERAVSAPAPDGSAPVLSTLSGEEWQLLQDQPVSAGCPFDEPVSAPDENDALEQELKELLRQERERSTRLDRERERSAALTDQPGRAEPLERAVSMLLAGVSVASAAEAQGVGASTLRRYQRVMKALELNGAEHPIDCSDPKCRVRADLVELIRAHVRSAGERGQGGGRS